MSNRMNLWLALGAAMFVGVASWTAAAAETEGGHKTAHGGCLSVIEECAIGHLEVKVEGDTLEAWFVGGDGATETSVRVAAKEIPLLVTTDEGETTRPLMLAASPLALAEETVGDCSHFVAKADWLKDVKEFVAVGVTKFKGATRVLRIDYPEGFDPDHDHEHGHDDHDDHDHDDDDHEHEAKPAK